jgi:carbon-monoxide dehydrogenase small subunit
VKAVPQVAVELTVNGVRHHVRVPTHLTLLALLRDHLGLTGTKEGCGRGDCGACTVILNGAAVLACLVPAFQAHGASVITVEGLAERGEDHGDDHGEERRGGALHPLQQAFIDEGAVQCGFCTPGMLMSAKALLDANPAPTREEIRRAIAGNLCRCTGYFQIVRAVDTAARRMSAGAPEFGGDRR